MTTNHPTQTAVFTFALDWLIDRDKRSLLAAISLLCGIVPISLYYLWLGFSPSLNLGQTSVLLIEALLVGGCIAIGMSLIYCAGWTYPYFEVDTDEFAKFRAAGIVLPALQIKDLRRAQWSLFGRSMSAQCVGICYLLIFVFAPKANDSDTEWAFLTSIILFPFLVWYTLTRKPLWLESNWTFAGTIFFMCFSGIFSAVLLAAIYGSAPERTHWGTIISAALFIVSFSAVLSIARKQLWAFKVVGVAMATIALLFYFDNMSLPLRILANTLGISEPNRVNLVVSETNCKQLSVAIKNQIAASNQPVNQNKKIIQCQGSERGLVSQVYLLNTLGERWVIRLEKDSENIVFEGKDTIVFRLPSPKSKKVT